MKKLQLIILSIMIILNLHAKDYSDYYDALKHIKVKTNVMCKGNSLIATVEFLNTSNSDINVPFWHMSIDSLMNDYFDIINESGERAEYKGQFVSFDIEDSHFKVFKKNSKVSVNTKLNDFYDIPDANKYYEIKYNNVYYPNSNKVKVYIDTCKKK